MAVLQRRARRLAVGVVAALSVLGVAACSPGGSGGESSAKTSSDVATNIADQGDVTLKMLDFWATGAENDWMNDVVKAFEKKYPNVTIKRTSKDWGDLNTTLNLRLSDKGGPDIATANQGWAALGTYASGGLVVNLDPYAETYGWADKVPDSILRQQQFSSDGKEMGTGSLYATPVASSSIIGINYNRTILDRLGIDVPKTLADFEAACAKIKAAGEVPINFASLDPGPATALLLSVQAMMASGTDIGNFVYGDTKVSVADTGLLEAAKKLKEWADNGWLTPDYSGIAYADSVDSFKKGKGAFQFNYSGTLSPTGDEQQGYGMFLLPQVGGDQTYGVGASRAAMVVSARSEHPDVAAAFLDFLMGKETAQLAVDNNLTPAIATDLTMPTDRPEFGEEVAAVQTLDQGDGYVPYFDWSTSTLYDTLTQHLQTMLAGKSSPQDMADAAEADRNAAAADR
jgi:raffinose/stachyose/melibiose transport system substrate-binding protein